MVEERRREHHRLGSVVPAWGTPVGRCGRRSTTWRDFIRRHMDVLGPHRLLHHGRSADLARGLVTYYVLFFIHPDSQPISIAGITDRPDACWMVR
jgi:hypothetical protein